MDSGIKNTFAYLVDIGSLPYGRINYTGSKGPAFRQGYLSNYAPLAVCSVRLYYKRLIRLMSSTYHKIV